MGTQGKNGKKMSHSQLRTFAWAVMCCALFIPGVNACPVLWLACAHAAVGVKHRIWCVRCRLTRMGSKVTMQPVQANTQRIGPSVASGGLCDGPKEQMGRSGGAAFPSTGTGMGMRRVRDGAGHLDALSSLRALRDSEVAKQLNCVLQVADERSVVQALSRDTGSSLDRTQHPLAFQPVLVKDALDVIGKARYAYQLRLCLVAEIRLSCRLPYDWRYEQGLV